MSNDAIHGWDPDAAATPGGTTRHYTGSWSITQPNKEVVFLATVAAIIPFAWPLTLYV
jgi:hypothetical protein